MDQFAKSFGDAINVIGVDKHTNTVPNTTLEIVTNVLGNLQSNTNHQQKEHYNQPQNKDTNNDTDNDTNNNIKPTKTITNISVFTLLKICLILAVSHFVLSTDFIKNNITKLTNNHLITYAIVLAVFIMITFITIKWSI
jgi:hypothetical protein